MVQCREKFCIPFKSSYLFFTSRIKGPVGKKWQNLLSVGLFQAGLLQYTGVRWQLTRIKTVALFGKQITFIAVPLHTLMNEFMGSLLNFYFLNIKIINQTRFYTMDLYVRWSHRDLGAELPCRWGNGCRVSWSLGPGLRSACWDQTLSLQEKKVESPSGRSLKASLSHPVTASFIPSLHFPECSHSLFVRQQRPPGGPVCDAFAVPTNHTDVARSDKSLLTGSTGSQTRVNCDCQPGETLALTPSAADLMRGIQRVDFWCALIPRGPFAARLLHVDWEVSVSSGHSSQQQERIRAPNCVFSSAVKQFKKIKRLIDWL